MNFQVGLEPEEQRRHENRKKQNLPRANINDGLNRKIYQRYGYNNLATFKLTLKTTQRSKLMPKFIKVKCQSQF